MCGKHFPASDFKEVAIDGKLTLKKDAVPTIFPSWPTHLKVVPVKRKRNSPRVRCCGTSSAAESCTYADDDSKLEASCTGRAEEADDDADATGSGVPGHGDSGVIGDIHHESLSSTVSSVSPLADHELYCKPCDCCRAGLLPGIRELKRKAAGQMARGLSLMAMQCVPDGDFQA